AEAQTGDDGVFQHDYKELKDSGDVRVFAIADGSTASNVVDLQGVGVATGLTDKGYLYTDRPAYRAGQTVHVRGVVRRALGDAYVIDKGKKYTLEVYDARNRMLRQEQVALGEFGGFHSHFLLPETSPAGDYRLQIADEAGVSYQSTFAVHEYQLEPIRLSVETDRKVFYRGEEITGKIVARFYYGAPLANREIRYQLAGERMNVATTDDNGEVAFKFSTRDFREAQTLPMTVAMPERNLQTAANFFLATQGFSIGVSTVRPVYVAGETFEVKIHTDDAEGKPIAEKLTLSVLEQTKVDGKLGERLVERHDLATDSEGDGRVTLKLADGARYVLRVEGTDRFKNPISGEHSVQVSDEDDSVRLRILAERHTFKVGDQAVVRLHWREQPALALVTFQGARVLGHQLVQLKTGTNDLPIAMTSKLAPNFELSIAVMTDTREAAKVAGAAKPRAIVRFHEANSPFTVERDLRIKIEPKRKGDAKGDLRPGEEIEVAVTATDPQGKPARAEISLAMVEQSLLEMFGSQVEAIHDFFAGGQRAAAVRTTSSVTFGYRPRTRPINSRLLAEKDRLEIEIEESARRGEFSKLATGESATVPFDTDGNAALGISRSGPGGDFDKLTELVTDSVVGTTWDQVGGAGNIAPFSDNLSLQISQNQEV
ncbi:MAG: MG2 domain-containing protein, partial [Pirellulales bacterium]